MGEAGSVDAAPGPGPAWASGRLVLVLATAVAVLLPVLATCWCRAGARWRARARAPGAHHWLYSDLFGRPTYCSACGLAALRGPYCPGCGACVHSTCLEAADQLLRCKQPLAIAPGPAPHHWQRGNLPLCNRCAVCGLQCGSSPRLCDQRCVWCQQVAHDGCLTRLPPACPLGPLPRAVLPPNYLHAVRRGPREPPADPAQYTHMCAEDWSPVLVLGNSRSGSNMAQSLMGEFCAILNPEQVVDLDSVTPFKALQLCRVLPPGTARVLVCGGDGTVGWVLDAIDEMKYKGQEAHVPAVAILPLGTGNDLARTLGWGAGYTGDTLAQHILQLVLDGQAQTLDRWRVRLTRGFYAFHRPKVYSMNNYFSIGPDALMALNFHERRLQSPGLFSSRLLNKAVYFFYGTRDCLVQTCRDLDQRIELEMDGERVDLPRLEGVIVLNIAYWGGGCRLWEGTGSQPYPLASHQDGLLEVVGVYGSFHCAQIHVGLADPLRLGQAHTVRLTLKSSVMPMQVDGEPWDQGPCTLLISHKTRALVIQAPPTASGREQGPASSPGTLSIEPAL